MSRYEWNETKNRRLKKVRGLSFEEIVYARQLDIIKHPTREDQRLMIFERRGYCWVVPCVKTEDGFFLKTLYPSRKFTKIYLGKEK
jgi:uncharacterized DUF497 family protein